MKQGSNFKWLPRESTVVGNWLARNCPSRDVNLRMIEFPDSYVKRLLLLLDDKFRIFLK